MNLLTSWRIKTEFARVYPRLGLGDNIRKLAQDRLAGATPVSLGPVPFPVKVLAVPTHARLARPARLLQRNPPSIMGPDEEAGIAVYLTPRESLARPTDVFDLDGPAVAGAHPHGHVVGVHVLIRSAVLFDGEMGGYLDRAAAGDQVPVGNVAGGRVAVGNVDNVALRQGHAGFRKCVRVHGHLGRQPEPGHDCSLPRRTADMREMVLISGIIVAMDKKNRKTQESAKCELILSNLGGILLRTAVLAGYHIFHAPFIPPMKGEETGVSVRT